MSKEEKSLINYESQSLIAKTLDRSQHPIFILCETCHWCATYLDKTRIPVDNTCPQCNTNNNNELSSMPIMFNESFIFDHNDKRGVELEFKPR